MLSLGKSGGGGHGYYIEAVARGIDEYHRGVGEAPGQWAGTAAATLLDDLDGEVTGEDLRAVWEGRDPRTGEMLAPFRGRTVGGYDLCFRAPKSVSLLFTLGSEEISAVVRAAHDAAVEAAFAYMQADAARSRVGKDGLNQIEVEGLVAAKFRHRTSRAGDPHLHTHVLVANMAPDADGVWRTLDGRLLYQYAKTGGYLYEAHLRYELTSRLGVAWREVDKGIADIVGIDQDVLDHFSDRSREIREHLDKIGFRSSRAAQLATLETRSAKDRTIGTASMRLLWEAKAGEIGFDPSTLNDVVGTIAGHALGVDEQAELFAHLLSGDGLTAQASSFDTRDVLRAVAEHFREGGTVEEIVALAEAFLELPEVVRLVEPEVSIGLTGTDVIRRGDGSIVAAPIQRGRWSTRELIELEQRLVGTALERVGDGSGTVAEDVLAEVLARRPTLSDEQAEMVTRLVREGNGVQVVCAAAGTGKTYTLDAVRDAWERAGYQVLGAAVAGRAAQELAASAGIKSSTLAMLKIDLAAGRVRLDDRTALVIDESGMAGTRTLAPILDAAHRAGTLVVLVGDPSQLPEIDAGGVLCGLAQRLDPIELIENRRQRSVWERDALSQLRNGSLDQAFEAYDRNGRVVTGRTADDVRNAMVADWWSYRLTGAETAMLAVRRSDVDDLNGRSRAYLVRSGEVHGPEMVIDDRPFQAGDNIICLRNDRRLGVCNGTKATITTVDLERQTLTIEANDRHIVLPAAYLDAGHVTHGYAMTIHKAQGATVDHGLLLGTDELYRERGYVGMSRGRDTNHLYLVGAAEPDISTGHGRPHEPGDPIDLVRQALRVENHQRLAIDTGDPLGAWSLEQLAAEKRRLKDVLAQCPHDQSHDVRALTDRLGQLKAENVRVVNQYNALADKRLRGKATRTEMSGLRNRIDRIATGVKRIGHELDSAQQAVKARERFLTDHQPDADRLAHVKDSFNRRMAGRIDIAAERPAAYLVAVLGDVPTTPDHRDIWKRGAILIESHRLDSGITDVSHAYGTLANGRPAPPPTEVRDDVRMTVRALNPEPPSIGPDLGLVR